MEIPAGYKLIDTLGEGSLATVYLAVGEFVEQEVALKLIKPEVCADAAFVESFLDRARLMSEHEHPHLVSIFDAGQTANSCYLVMAYVAGRTLRHRRFELTLAEQLAVIKTIAEALDFTHQQGCEHGRLTLDNILLRDSDHRVIVTDFLMGRAPIGNAEQRYYLSPEQHQGQEADHRSDFYSLGVILLLLLGGRLRQVPEYESQQTIDETDADKAESKTKSTGWSLPEGLSVFHPIIEQSLARNPEDRYQSGAELISDLNAISESELEAAARAGALALLSEAENDTKPLESKAVHSQGKEDSGVSGTEMASEPADVPSHDEPHGAGARETGVPNDSELEEGLSKAQVEVVKTEFQAGALRVWAQDRIDQPLEPKSPPWWLIGAFGLAALMLVGGVLVAALLD